MAAKVNASAVKFGCGLSLKAARERGLRISVSRGKTPIGIEAPALYSGSGVFTARPEGSTPARCELRLRV